ncbi:MAG: hypothetical protein LBK27_01725, partial [Treponema sp.]|nr:hypothetical protein [Treponema sp.]
MIPNRKNRLNISPAVLGAPFVPKPSAFPLTPLFGAKSSRRMLMNTGNTHSAPGKGSAATNSRRSGLTKQHNRRTHQRTKPVAHKQRYAQLVLNWLTKLLKNIMIKTIGGNKIMEIKLAKDLNGNMGEKISELFVEAFGKELKIISKDT